jgi:general nucleoside transport system permease protein
MTDVMASVETGDRQGPSAEDNARARSRFGSLGEIIVLYALSIGAALVLSAMLVTFTGGSWQDVMNALLDGSVRRPGRWGQTLGVAAPLLLVALGTIINAKAGLVNIGQEGQLLIGAAFATYFGVRLGGPGPVVLVALLLAGAVGGALWAGIAGGLRYWRGVPEVLSSLLLVTIAANLVGFGLKKQWLLLAPAAGRANRNQVSEQLAADTRLPRWVLFGNNIPSGAVLAVVLAVLVGAGLAWSVWGFRLRILGRNPRAAQRAGVSERRYGMAAMLASGGFAGLAGGVMLAGGDFATYQLVPGFSANIGWTGLLVALVARERAMVAVVVAFVFAALRTGSGFLAATGVERRITDVVQALLVLALLIPPAVLFIRERRRALAAARSRT